MQNHIILYDIFLTSFINRNITLVNFRVSSTTPIASLTRKVTNKYFNSDQSTQTNEI